MSRPDWDSYFFRLAAEVATRATCPRASIGALLVKNRRVIGTGYNGVADGREHCPNTPEHMALAHCQDAIHAEYNALANALVPPFGAVLYVVGPRTVCPNCADRLRENGVTRVKWRASVPTLDGVIRDVLAWQRATFFPPSLDDVEPTVRHLRREVDELTNDPFDFSEVADVLILLARLADNLGTDLATVAANTLAVLKTRQWQPADADGVTEHIRETVS